MENNPQSIDGRQEKKSCVPCNQSTNHTLLYVLGGWLSPIFRVDEDAETPTMEGKETSLKQVWLIWRCNGCDSLLLQESWVYAEEFETDPIGAIDGASYYPPQEKRRMQLKQFERIPDKLKTIYEQTHNAYVHELDILCAVGLRSLIEGICDDQEISGKHDKLEKKIANLPKLGVRPNRIKNLHSFRFMGNTAIHELTAPNPDDLRLAIEIIEDILNDLYNLDYRLTLLNERQKQNPKFLVPEDNLDSDQPE